MTYKRHHVPAAIGPWNDHATVNRALRLACEVRDEPPDDIAERLDHVGGLANLVIVLAAMVDVDQPLSSLRRWAAPKFIGYREADTVIDDPTAYPLCPKGLHPMTPMNARTSEGGRKVTRCRACDRNRKRAA